MHKRTPSKRIQNIYKESQPRDRSKTWLFVQPEFVCIFVIIIPNYLRTTSEKYDLVMRRMNEFKFAYSCSFIRILPFGNGMQYIGARQPNTTASNEQGCLPIKYKLLLRISPKSRRHCSAPSIFCNRNWIISENREQKQSCS